MFTRIPSSLALLGWILLTFLAPAAGAWTPPDAWYQTLAKPAWTPPSWLFGPVWTILYLLMAIAAWLVWRQGGWRKQAQALTLFLGQLILNGLWTPIFFGGHQLGWAAVEILLLWLAIVATLLAFARADRRAAWLLVPYLLWVTFASALSVTLWRMNS